MPGSISLRRATIAERRAKRQAVVMVVVGLVVLAIFVIYAVPLLFDVAIRVARTQPRNQVIDKGDIIPPQQPVITPLAEFSKDKHFEIKGFTEPKAEVQLVVDTLQNSSVAAGDDGSFTFTLDLEEGKHEIWVVAQDAAGNSSPESDHFPVTVDVTAPTLSITSPSNGSSFSLPREKVQTIKGVLSEKGTVLVNSNLVTTNDKGEFQATVQLGNGHNEFTIKGTDLAGNQTDEQKISFEYNP